MTPEPRSHRSEWMAAFHDYCRSLPAEDVVRCPECESTTLRLVFPGSPETREGICCFWCDTCHFGMFHHRMVAPDNVDVIAPPDPRLENIPNFVNV
jgi:hypothetical protein